MPKEMPFFSIIIPVYNCASYLQQCVNSILTQSFSDLELILIDDGSKDESLQICQYYANVDSRVNTIHKKNGGASAARNTGLGIAKGQYIMFVDADDWIEPDTLSAVNEACTDNIEVIFYGLRCAIDDSFKIFQYAYRESHNRDEFENLCSYLLDNKLRQENYGFTCNKVIRRDVIVANNIRFDENVRVKEDEIFTNNVCKYVTKAKILPIAPYNYRISFGNSLSFVKRDGAEFEDMANKLLESYGVFETNVMRDIIDRNYVLNMSKAIALYLKEGRLGKAWDASCSTNMFIKENKVRDNLIDRLNFKDRIRYRFSNALWLYFITFLFKRFY